MAKILGRGLYIVQMFAAMAGIAAPASAQTGLRYEYAAQVDCGLANQDIASSNGIYVTTVNIHNPGPQAVFRWKVASTVPITAPNLNGGGPVSGFSGFHIGSDQAVRIDCNAVRARNTASGILNPAFLSVFVVVQSDFPLDVVAVYSAMPIAGANGGPIVVLHLERVPARPIG
jgi:hypothetical protein